VNEAISSPGWFKAMRGETPRELRRKNPNAYALAAVIADRARWTDGFNADGLALGEALLGDFEEYGMTRQQYRTALALLCKNNFATTRITNKGTIAKLIDTRLFDPLNLASNQQSNQQPTTAQPTANQPATTNEEGKKAKKGEERPKSQELKRSNGAELVLRQKELERVEAKMKHIADGYDSLQTWSDDDRREHKRLKLRKKELMATLGLAA
jgi:hypothetical protein